MDRFSILSKKTVVTGSARGIGACVARAFAEAGADVALVDISPTEGFADELRKKGVNVISVTADVTKKADVDDMVRQVTGAFGGIDILFNNAGICINERAEDMTEEAWNRIIDINLTGIFLVAQAVGRVMLEQGKGAIINTASVAGHVTLRPQPQVGYNASKAGVLLLTRSLAGEWAKRGVRVNSISPGYILSDMTEKSPHLAAWGEATPMGRLGNAEELVGAIIYLASDAASYTTGTDIAVDGGLTAF